MSQWLRGTDCSRRPEFKSQNLHGGSQLSSTPVLKDSMHTSDLLWHWTYVMHRHSCRLKHTYMCVHEHTHTRNKKFKKKLQKRGNCFIDKVYMFKVGNILEMSLTFLQLQFLYSQTKYIINTEVCP